MKVRVMSLYFSGFTPEALEFLSELAQNNTKEWYDAHKPMYEKLLKNPSLGLLDVMSERFEDLGLAYLSTPKVSLFRQHRDTRFSNNKNPYKTNYGMHFPYYHHATKTKPINAPGLYIHIEPKQMFMGGGLYMPMPESLKLIRERIADEWQILEAIVENPLFKAEFPRGLYGESTSRVPRGYEQDHPGAQYLKLKQFLVECTLKEEELYTEQIIDIIEAKSLALAPLLEYITEALES